LCGQTVEQQFIPALAIASSVVQHAEKANAQIGTFGFCRPTSQTQKTKRAYFFAHARTD